MKTVFKFILLALFISSHSAFAKEVDQEISIVLLIGQSNMAGQGKIEDQDTVPIPGVLKLTSHYFWTPARDPLGSDKPREFGVGPGREFARALLEAQPNARVGLVSAAVGNTNLQQWMPGGRLYNRAILRLRMAQRSGKLVAILWHQGESDSNNEARAKVYAKKWVIMMRQLRKDARAPDVPILVGTLGDYLDKPYAGAINEEIRKLPTMMQNVSVVPATGLTERGDGVHFDSKSQREFGRRFAKAFLTINPDWADHR